MKIIKNKSHIRSSIESYIYNHTCNLVIHSVSWICVGNQVLNFIQVPIDDCVYGSVESSIKNKLKTYEF